MHHLPVKLSIKNNILKSLFTSLLLVFLCSNNIYAQEQVLEYSYNEIELSCPSKDMEIEKLYRLGLKALSSTKYHNVAGKIFFSIIERDKTLCDAYFFTALALTKQDKHEAALTYYYYADSLASKSNAVFKEELAEAALRVNNVGLARKKYEELIKDFPEDPDGYYGIGLTATTLGDIAHGLQKLSVAEELYIRENTWTEQRKLEVYLMKGILFIADTQYKIGLEYLDKCFTVYHVLDDYNANYAIGAEELYKDTKDESYKQKAIKAFYRIKDKNKLNETFLKRFYLLDSNLKGSSPGVN